MNLRQVGDIWVVPSQVIAVSRGNDIYGMVVLRSGAILKCYPRKEFDNESPVEAIIRRLKEVEAE